VIDPVTLPAAFLSVLLRLSGSRWSVHTGVLEVSDGVLPRVLAESLAVSRDAVHDASPIVAEFAASERSIVIGRGFEYPTALETALKLARAYHLARGEKVAVAGAFLIDAARRYDSANATGIAGALSALKQQQYGHWLLGAVAVGLICYGLFQILKERYRKLRTS